jgi:hypothetical protein
MPNHDIRISRPIMPYCSSKTIYPPSASVVIPEPRQRSASLGGTCVKEVISVRIAPLLTRRLASPNASLRKISECIMPSPYVPQKAKEITSRTISLMRRQKELDTDGQVMHDHLEVVNSGNLSRTGPRAVLVRPRSSSLPEISDFTDVVMKQKLHRVDRMLAHSHQMRIDTWERAGVHVYRAVDEGLLRHYRAANAIRSYDPENPLRRSTYFTDIAGNSPDEHRQLAQMPPAAPDAAPLVLLRVPACKLQNVCFPRPDYGQAAKGLELFTSSFPTFGKGGARQIMAFTREWSNEWIDHRWDAPAPDPALNAFHPRQIEQ